VKLCLACEETFQSDDWTCPRCGRAPEKVAGHLAFAPQLAESNDGYDPELFADIPGIDDEHFLRKARNRLFTWAMGRYFPDAYSLLEIGSGIGAVLKAFRGAYPDLQLAGSDLYVTGLDELEQNVPRVLVFQADARRLPFRQEFDVVAAFDTLEHIDDDVGVLRQMYSASKPGGGILVSVPQHPFLWSQRDVCLHHKRRYTRRELLEKVRATGFAVARLTSFVTLPFPMMALAAVRNRKPREGYDPFAEFKLGRATNAALDVLLSCESKAVKAGVSLPFGGTLLLVGRRV
jgi:SAM-dependent methyltransferase